MPQSLSSILIHLIFSTKNRKNVITSAIEPKLHGYLAAVFREHDSPALIINGTENHIHALFVLSRKYSVAHIVEMVKKRSSKWIKTQNPAFREFEWQPGYAAFSIGESGKAAAVAYIRKQKEHHRRTTFELEVKAFLERYRIKYDEKYLWD